MARTHLALGAWGHARPHESILHLRWAVFLGGFFVQASRSGHSFDFTYAAARGAADVWINSFDGSFDS